MKECPTVHPVHFQFLGVIRVSHVNSSRMESILVRKFFEIIQFLKAFSTKINVPSVQKKSEAIPTFYVDGSRYTQANT